MHMRKNSPIAMVSSCTEPSAMLDPADVPRTPRLAHATIKPSPSPPITKEWTTDYSYTFTPPTSNGRGKAPVHGKAAQPYTTVHRSGTPPPSRSRQGSPHSRLYNIYSVPEDNNEVIYMTGNRAPLITADLYRELSSIREPSPRPRPQVSRPQVLSARPQVTRPQVTRPEVARPPALSSRRAESVLHRDVAQEAVVIYETTRKASTPPVPDKLSDKDYTQGSPSQSQEDNKQLSWPPALSQQDKPASVATNEAAEVKEQLKSWHPGKPFPSPPGLCLSHAPRKQGIYDNEGITLSQPWPSPIVGANASPGSDKAADDASDKACDDEDKENMQTDDIVEWVQLQRAISAATTVPVVPAVSVTPALPVVSVDADAAPPIHRRLPPGVWNAPRMPSRLTLEEMERPRGGYWPPRNHKGVPWRSYATKLSMLESERLNDKCIEGTCGPCWRCAHASEPWLRMYWWWGYLAKHHPELAERREQREKVKGSDCDTGIQDKAF